MGDRTAPTPRPAQTAQAGSASVSGAAALAQTPWLPVAPWLLDNLTMPRAFMHGPKWRRHFDLRRFRSRARQEGERAGGVFGVINEP